MLPSIPVQTFHLTATPINPSLYVYHDALTFHIHKPRPAILRLAPCALVRLTRTTTQHEFSPVNTLLLPSHHTHTHSLLLPSCSDLT